MAELKIRKVTSVEEFAHFTEMSAKHGLRPGIDDGKSFLAADPDGFFIGELDGKKIASISAVVYKNKLAFVGLLIVDKAFRGKGYGGKMLREGLARVPQEWNAGLDAEEGTTPIYEKKGFKTMWTNTRFELDPSVIVTKQSLSDGIIKSTAEVNFNQLADYDAVMFGAPRDSFLKEWIAAPHARGFAAVNSSGELLGYTVIRKVIVDGEGYRVGPLFANNLDTARNLLAAAAKFASDTTPDDKYVYIDVPDRNPQAVGLVQEMSGVDINYPTYRMYTKGDPNLPMTKIYGMTSIELG